MKLLLSTLRKTFPGFNKKAYTFDNGLAIAKRHNIRINIVSYEDDIMGYFCIKRVGKKVRRFIVINSKLNEIDRTFVLLHEIAHFFLHVPVSAGHYYFCRRTAKRSESKNECEATAAALILMIPLALLLKMRETPFAELSETEIGYYVKRQRLYETELI